MYVTNVEIITCFLISNCHNCYSKHWWSWSFILPSRQRQSRMSDLLWLSHGARWAV